MTRALVDGAAAHGAADVAIAGASSSTSSALSDALWHAAAAPAAVEVATLAAAPAASSSGSDGGGGGLFAPLTDGLELILKSLQTGLDAVHVPYSYGYSIILLTLLVKLVTLPLTKQQVGGGREAVPGGSL